jgi:MFS family permease
MSSKVVERSVVDRALRISIIDGVLAALMLGASESYFGACAVSLGHGDAALGILATLPLCVGALAQALTGPLVLWLGSRKRLVAAGAFVQALSHLGLIALAACAVKSFWLLLALVLLYYVSGMVTVPAWGAWMGALTEETKNRERYFALRSTCVSVSMLSSFLWAGYKLQHGVAHHDVAHAYAWVFAVGFVARLASSYLLHRQPDPHPPQRDSLKRVMARTRSAVRGDGFRLVLVLGVWMAGAQISVPYYAPYMLKVLDLGYDGYALLCALQLISKAMFLPFAHRVSKQIGLQRMLIGSMAGAAMVAFLWGSQRSLPGLVLAQLLSGPAWAAYEFASFQLYLGASRRSERVEFLAMSASFVGLMQLCGALLGSFFLTRLGLSYREVFLISSLARALPLLTFMTEYVRKPEPSLIAVREP